MKLGIFLITIGSVWGFWAAINLFLGAMIGSQERIGYALGQLIVIGLMIYWGMRRLRKPS